MLSPRTFNSEEQLSAAHEAVDRARNGLRAASGQIRQAVLYDYVKSDLEETQNEGPQPDMWRDWSQALRDA